MTTFRSDNSAPPSPGDVTGPAVVHPNAAHDLNELLNLIARRDPSVVELFNTPEFGERAARVYAALHLDQGSRPDLTGTPAQTMEPLTFARVGDYAAAKTIGGKLLLVDETEEGTPIATFHSIADGVRFWRFVERLVSRPDLTGETPPASAETSWARAALNAHDISFGQLMRIAAALNIHDVDDFGSLAGHVEALVSDFKILRARCESSGGGPPPETTREGQ